MKRAVALQTILVLFLGGPANIFADGEAAVDRLPRVLSLSEAIQFGLNHYPAIRTAVARVSAAQSGVDLSRTAYLPRIEVGYQANRGTFNNVSGLWFFNAWTQPISGPDLGKRSSASAWGSSAGIGAGWEPFDFGLRAANVEAARSVERHAHAEISLTQLQVGAGVGEAFLTLVAAQETVQAMKADVERRQIFTDTVGVLVKNRLRPGVEASRAMAELAGARTRLIQAEQTQEIARARLAEVLGVAGDRVDIQATPLVTLPRAASLEPTSLIAHPLAKTQEATAEVFRRRKEAWDRAWVPKVMVQGSFFGRGSGWDAQGNHASGLNGLGPDAANYAGGLTFSFSLFDVAAIRANRQTEAHREEAERARYAEVMQALRGADARARAVMDGARRVAENTPIQVDAAQQTEGQARARYQAGLANVVEVAEAQGLLVQASVDDALARLGVWHALLGSATALGNLQPFLDLLQLSSEGGH
jgi:outer membrane protein